MKTNNRFNTLLLAIFLISSCAKSQPASSTANSVPAPATASKLMINPIDPNEFSFAAAEANTSELQADPVRQRLGQFFLVEHFAVTVDSTMLSAIRQHQPGGILFWNPNKATGASLREVIRQYSVAAKTAHHDPILFSTDYEGGGNPLTPSGKDIPGVQRFTDGFTLLAHPIWMGKSYAKNGPELCSMQGEIMATELASVGINYPLATVSDLAMMLMTDRGISRNPEIVTKCMQQLIEAFRKQGKMIFVTKHFPGLGQVPGDTHEEVAVSRSSTLAEMQPHIQPFQDTIEFVNASGLSPIYSVIASHAKYPPLDPDNLTTESSIILTDLLRKKLGMQGIVLSDAMWMGGYGTMKTDELMPVYLNSFVSGMDMLMIPGSRFADAVTYFRGVYDNSLSPAQKSTVETKMKRPWDEVRAAFLARVTESQARILKSELEVGHAADSISPAGIEPVTLTSTIDVQYQDILKTLNPAL